MEANEKPDWSAALQQERERRGLSRPALAARAGISPSAVKAFENGRRYPKAATLNALIDALGLSRDEASPILQGAGHPDDWYAIMHDRFPSDVLDLIEQANTCPWPVFISNQAIDVVHANACIERVLNVDLSREFTAPDERNFLAQASSPRFVEMFENFDELVTYMVGLVKGDPRWQQSPENPSPWMQGPVQSFLKGDPDLVQRVLSLWAAAPPRPHRTRHSYAVRLRHPELGRLSFRGSTTIADLWAELSFNEWVPEDAATLEAMKAIAR